MGLKRVTIDVTTHVHYFFVWYGSPYLQALITRVQSRYAGRGLRRRSTGPDMTIGCTMLLLKHRLNTI